MPFFPPKMSLFSHDFVLYTTCGTFLYAICAGFRDNYGIMLPYIVGWSGLSHATVSFIIGLGQLFFGLMQPVFGLLALRTSNRFVLCAGSLMMLSGLALIPVSRSAWMLTFSLGILLPSGTAAASFGIIMSCISPKLPPAKVHISSGFVASGIGIGICVLSPLIQSFITAHGLTSALIFLSVPVLLLIPISLLLTHATGAPQTKAPVCAEGSAADMLHSAFQNPVYRRLTFGFFTCGFHMALLQTHLFSQLTSFGLTEKTASLALSVYGLGAIAGATGSGMACARFAMSRILGGLYTSRCAWGILLLSPLPLPVLFAVIFLLGMTGVSTIAPTSGLVGKLFGPLRLATLFGLVYLNHQIGAFCSAWVGGLCLRHMGNYSGIWYADIALSLLAGLACLSIKEHQNPPPETA